MELMVTPEDAPCFEEAEFIDQLRAGDAAACAACIREHGPDLYRLALRMMHDEADAEDVLQETFLAAFRNIAGFEGRSSLGTWLYRIAANTALMKLRRPGPDLVSVEEVTEESDLGRLLPQQLHDDCCRPEIDFEAEERQQALRQALHKLPETLRSVFLLRDLQGLSTAATAAVLDLTESAVKKRLQRARLQLRAILAEYFDE